eukprot:Nitzschia sp. Nitz4//scaffold43_size134323//37625//38780//NITZ4_003289-RA/size134323-snap-gene-0.55-mRNA-1//1//CDS//3329551918//5497//frame0
MTMKQYWVFLATLCQLVLILPCHGKESLPTKILSPLQTLTIPDRIRKSPRELYLERLEAGLQAEVQARREYQRKEEEWKKATKEQQGNNKLTIDEQLGPREQFVESAWDKAVSRVRRQQKQQRQQQERHKNEKEKNRYQFVGVVRPSGVQWYARKKPRKARWSVRLVQCNQGHLLHDMYQDGKVDLFARYTNHGVDRKSLPDGRPIVTVAYEARERTWKNMWNFSPKKFVTHRSGFFWRERRLESGVYTDGKDIFEVVYNYFTGRNGMRSLCSLKAYNSRKTTIPALGKDTVVKTLQEKKGPINSRQWIAKEFLQMCGPASPAEKEMIDKRLNEDNPDIVWEFRDELDRIP